MLRTATLEAENGFRKLLRRRILRAVVGETYSNREAEGPARERVDAGPQEAQDAAREVAELRAVVRNLERQLGRLEGRLELTEVTESTLREQLERERERADRLEEYLRDAEAEIHAVEAALYDARRGWFRRFFGIGEIRR